MKYIETRVNKGEIIVHWGTARDAMKMQKAVHAVASLRNTQHHAKTFRPSILVLSKKPREAHHDALFAHSMKKGHGCLIVGHVKIGDPSENVSLHNKDYDAYYQVDPTEFAYTEFCDKIQGKKIIKTRPRTKDNAFCPMDEVVSPSVYAGSLSLMQLSGIGSMRPNIVQMGFKKYWLKSYAEGGCSGTAKADEKMKNLQDAHEHVQVLDAAMKMHFGVVLTSNLEGIKFDSFIEKKEVHVWWFAPDGGLALLLPRIMLKSKFWKRR